VFFEADYDEIELQNIVMTSSPLHHRKTLPNNVRKIFQFGPPLIKISGYASTFISCGVLIDLKMNSKKSNLSTT